MQFRFAFVMFLTMTTSVIAEQNAAVPAAITDPQKIQSKANAEVQQWQLSIEKLFTVRRVGGAAWSPDGRQIAFISNISGRNNLWLVPAEGGWPVQLTISDQRQASPAWSPDGKWIAYISDHDGDEQWDIFLVSPTNGDVVNLTNTPDIAEESPAWSPDGRYLAYQVKPRTSSSFEIHVMDVLTRKVRHLTTGTPADLGNNNPIWSRDGKWIAYTQEHAAGKNSNIFVAEVSTDKSTLLTPHEGEHNFSASDWSPNGRKLLITSNAGNAYDNVGLLDVASKKIDWLTQDKWEAVAGYFSPEGRQVTWTVNVDGNVQVVLHDLAAHRSQMLPIAAGVNSLGGAESAFTRDGSRLLYFHNGPDSPRDAWVYSFAGQRSRQVTHSFVGGVRSSDLVQPFLVHYPSTDGKWTISAFVYVPYNMQRDGRNAAVVYVHGGPAAQTVNGFDRIVQYLANAGYLVIAPNYRGSTGYGKEFMDANRFDMGGGDLADVLAAAEWIKKSGYPDPKKIVLMGGSYGGYMTMMGVTKAPEDWAAGVAIVPFVNWFTEVQNEDPLLQRYDLATMGDPEKNKALWEERSPINFVDRIKAPLSLLAGGHDPRCPKEESEQVGEAIKKHGGVVELKIYENEGHGFARIENQIDAYKRVAEFLKKHVPPAECGCTLQ
ncbi:MAG TPA: S9 family peptidase [Terriglobales bacterium]|nr:S9 family peptidase [Terriglobales bacterium]